MLLSPRLALAHQQETFAGWSADLTAYGYSSVNDGDGGEDLVLCRSDPSTPSPSWPKGISQPERGSACSHTPQDESGIYRGGAQRQKLLDAYLVGPVVAKRGPKGERVTLQKSGESYTITAGANSFTRVVDVEELGESAQIATMWWRPDGRAVAYLVVGRSQLVFVNAMDGGASESPARLAAMAANARGMGRYKVKDWSSASRELRAAIALDESWAMPHYNLACVAALQRDVVGTVEQLEWLTRSSDPAARARLQKALTDPDFALVRDDAKVQAVLRAKPATKPVPSAAGSALTRRIGLAPLGWTDKPTETAEGENNDCAEYKSFELSLPDGKLTGDYSEGVVLESKKGIARSETSLCLLAIGAAQLVPDDEPELIAHRVVQVNRGAYVDELVVWKRDGKRLVEVFVGEFAERGVADNLHFESDGTIRYRAPDSKKMQTLRWNAAKKKFTP